MVAGLLMSCSSLSQVIELLQDTDYCKSCMETEELGPSKAFKIPVGDIFKAVVVTAAVVTAAYKLSHITFQTQANPQRL